MADESAQGAVAATEAAVIDAAVVGAETANTAAQAALASAATAAANAEAEAAARTEQLTQQVGEQVARQNNEIAGLADHISQVQSWQTETHSRLQTIAERQEKTETALSSLLTLLTPPPRSEEPKTEEPTNLPKEGAEGQKEAATSQPARPKHRWI